MHKEAGKNESASGSAAGEQAYQILKTRLRWRIQRAQRFLKQRAGVELLSVEMHKQ
jgi:hypothetical protein